MERFQDGWQISFRGIKLELDVAVFKLLFEARDGVLRGVLEVIEVFDGGVVERG